MLMYLSTLTLSYHKVEIIPLGIHVTNAHQFPNPQLLPHHGPLRLNVRRRLLQQISALFSKGLWWFSVNTFDYNRA